jgi:hypothetical protein
MNITVLKARLMMPFTKADIRDATLLFKAGNIEATRRILNGSSDDPRARMLLAKFEARFPSQTRVVSQPTDEMTEIKRLIRQKKFDAAEMVLSASNHPNASRLLKKIALMKLGAQPVEKKKPRSRFRSMLSSLFSMLS